MKATTDAKATDRVERFIDRRAMSELYRIAIYLRQSKDADGNELAVSRQREDCLKLCRDRGWTDTVEYCDNNVSASKRSVARPRYRQMLRDVKAGLIQGIVVWDLDRLYRQPRELEDLIDLADEHHLALATVTGDVDLSTDNGRLFARIKGAVAKAEGERKAARWRRSFEQGAAAGRWVATHRPFGYTIDGEPLQPEAGLLRQAYEDVLGGKSLRGIALDWNAAGVPTVRGAAWTNNRIRRMLLNPRYAALRVQPPAKPTPGQSQPVPAEPQYVQGVWEPIVDEAVWRGVVALLSDSSRAICTTFEIAHMGSGVYRCGRCDSPLKTAYDKHGKRLYRCKEQPHLSRRGEPLDDLVTAWLLERLSQPDAHDIMPVEGSGGVDVVALQAERAQLSARKSDLSAALREGLLDLAAVRRDSEILSKRIERIDRELADAVRVSPAAGLRAAAGDAERLWATWKGMSPAQQGQAVDELLAVTVQPCPLGLRSFAPQYIDIDWQQ